MRVYTSDTSDFEKFTEDLITALNLSAEESCCVLAVANGGIPLARIVKKKLSESVPILDYAEIVCQRPSTVYKKKPTRKKLIEFTFKYTPQCLSNLARLLEHTYLSLRRKNYVIRDCFFSNKTPVHSDVFIIVDDAIDSGYSIKCVRDYVAKKYPLSHIKTAVFTTTQKDPVYRADFSAYDRVLVRFPWSLDAQK